MSLQLQTRSHFICEIFGLAQPFSGRTLPTCSEVIKAYIFHLRSLIPNSNTINIAEKVANDIENIWKSVSIPVVSHNRVLALLKGFYAEYVQIRKPYKQRIKTSAFYRERIKSFQEDNAFKLFDIATCKCPNFANCTCCKNNKVAVLYQAFLVDQRTVRLMKIGNTDKIESEKNLERLTRKAKILRSQTKQELNTSSKPKILRKNFRHTIAADIQTTDDHSNELTVIGNGSISLPTVARVCDRFGISDRAAAALSTAVLEDMRLISSDKSEVIDKNKIRREKKKERKSLTHYPQSINALYFDGRKDKTITINRNGKSHRMATISEEHIVLMQEPQSHYLGHVTPTSGSAINITNSIIEFLTSNSIGAASLVAIGCDGTPTNTGKPLVVIV